jgi:hypothetical protein
VIIVFLLYFPNFTALKAATPQWLSFILNPGSAEAKTIADLYKVQLSQYNYPTYALLYAIVISYCTIASIIGSIINSRNSMRVVYLNILTVCACAALIFFIAARSAGTTVFEAFLFFTALSCFTIAIHHNKKASYCIAAFLLCISGYHIYQEWSSGGKFGVPGIMASAKNLSRDLEFHNHMLTVVKPEQPTIIIVPDNNYCNSTIETAFLKGFAAGTGWDIHASRPILEKFMPGLYFSHDGSKILDSLNFVAPLNAKEFVMVWFGERNAPWINRYANIVALRDNPTTKCEGWQAPGLNATICKVGGG